MSCAIDRPPFLLKNSSYIGFYVEVFHFQLIKSVQKSTTNGIIYFCMVC